MIRPNNIYMMWWSVEMKWKKLFRWNMHFREMFLSCTLMFSFASCSKVFLFCAIWGTAVWFACFSTENYKFKKKEKKIFSSCMYRSCKDKAKENQEKTIREKQVSNTEILDNLKTVLNQRIHFDHNEHDPITIRNSFHDSNKNGPLYFCSSCTQTVFKHYVQRVDRT